LSFLSLITTGRQGYGRLRRSLHKLCSFAKATKTRGIRASLRLVRKLLARHALVNKKPKIDPAVFGSSVLSLVRFRRILLPHCTRRNNVLYLNVTILEQIGDHGLSPLLAEFLVVFKSACRVGIPSEKRF
jgi:hypothetical protein